MAVTREDDAYLLTRSASKRFASDTPTQSLVAGEVVRDYAAYPEKALLFPYKSGGDSAVLGPRGSRWLWPCRPHLAARKALSGTQQQRGLTWFEYSDFKARRWSAPRKIGFAYVATHNHFVLERGDSVYIRTAPVISLPAGATEEESLRLIGLLNSSTACFWLKQVSHSKGNATASSGMPDQPWSWNWEFTGTKLQEFPLPESYPVALSRLLDDLARKSALCTPRATTSSEIPSRSKLLAAREEWISLRAQMVSAQEELDWLVYSLYGLTDEDFSSVRPPELTPGERAFEIVLARLIKSGQAKSKWFTHHNLKPITELPDHWSDEYRSLVERRIQIIESDINIALIEVPECKRRWTTKGWDAMQAGALRDWLLDRLEEADLWGAAPTPLSVAQLADRLRHDEAFRSVLDLWVGSDQHDLTKTLGRLVADEYVPYLSSLRYKPSGIRKRLQWEQTWELQRREDLGEDVDIPLPPKYGSGDFLKPSYLRHRGKLDIPKERFISYQNAGRDGDPTLLLGWAGWDHLAQAQALATVYLDRKNQAAWKKEALLPLLAGLAELEPWLKQWHDEPRPGFPGSPAQFFTSLIDTELALLGADRAELTLIRGLG